MFTHIDFQKDILQGLTISQQAHCPDCWHIELNLMTQFYFLYHHIYVNKDLLNKNGCKTTIFIKININISLKLIGGSYRIEYRMPYPYKTRPMHMMQRWKTFSVNIFVYKVQGLWHILILILLNELSFLKIYIFLSAL